MQSLMFLCVSCAVIGQIAPAAIPMWEYLSKDEKMSYLYSMFANQVEDFCETHSMRDCNRELLKFGLGKLKGMPEDHLDTMDPYQRGAHNLIWDSMMEGHEMMSKRPKEGRPVTTTTTKPNSYNDQSFSQDYQGQASAKIDSVYRLPPPKNFFVQNPQFTMSSGGSQYRYPNAVTHRPSIANSYHPRDNDEASAPLTGPMVVKVHLDGTPVRERTDYPHDEDLRQYHMSKARIPHF